MSRHSSEPPFTDPDPSSQNPRAYAGKPRGIQSALPLTMEADDDRRRPGLGATPPGGGQRPRPGGGGSSPRGAPRARSEIGVSSPQDGERVTLPQLALLAELAQILLELEDRGAGPTRSGRWYARAVDSAGVELAWATGATAAIVGAIALAAALEGVETSARCREKSIATRK